MTQSEADLPDPILEQLHTSSATQPSVQDPPPTSSAPTEGATHASWSAVIEEIRDLRNTIAMSMEVRPPEQVRAASTGQTGQAACVFIRVTRNANQTPDDRQSYRVTISNSGRSDDGGGIQIEISL